MSTRILATALIVVLADRGSKRLVSGRLREGEERRLAPLVQIRRQTRRHLSFRDGGRSWMLLLAWVAIVLVLDLEVRHTTVWRHPLAQVGLGAALGGAIANLWDRLSRRGIVDFIAVGRWPVFNVADAAITLGVALALCLAWV